MTEALLLGKRCAACGSERKSKNMRYDPSTLLGYCDNPYVCNEEHPNSTKNVILRQSEAQLIGYDQANEEYKARLLANHTGDEANEISKILTKATSVRILDPDLAKFMVAFRREKEFPTMTDVIRYALEQLQENRGEYRKEKNQLLETKSKKERAAAAVRELETSPAATAKTKTDDLTF